MYQSRYLRTTATSVRHSRLIRLQTYKNFIVKHAVQSKRREDESAKNNKQNLLRQQSKSETFRITRSEVRQELKEKWAAGRKHTAAHCLFTIFCSLRFEHGFCSFILDVWHKHVLFFLLHFTSFERFLFCQTKTVKLENGVISSREGNRLCTRIDMNRWSCCHWSKPKRGEYKIDSNFSVHSEPKK